MRVHDKKEMFVDAISAALERHECRYYHFETGQLRGFEFVAISDLFNNENLGFINVTANSTASIMKCIAMVILGEEPIGHIRPYEEMYDVVLREVVLAPYRELLAQTKEKAPSQEEQ